MHKGFIEVSEPLNFEKDQHITFRKDSRHMICLLKGKIRKDNKILLSGDIYGLDKLINRDFSVENLIVEEDSTVVTINVKSLDPLIVSNKDLIYSLLSSTVDYITDVKDNLLKEGLS